MPDCVGVYLYDWFLEKILLKINKDILVFY